MSTLDLWPIGNCQVSGLVDKVGALVWACVPRVDGDPVFAALMNDDADSGRWQFELSGQHSVTQSYRRNTPILVTRIDDTSGGAIEIVDFCPRFERAGRMYRPVAFVRLVRPVAGTPRLRVRLSPVRDYGAEPAATTSGSNHIRYLVADQPLRLTTDAPVGNILDGRPFRAERPLHFFLGPDEPFAGNIGHDLDLMLDRTEAYWQQWSRGLATPLEWQGTSSARRSR